MRISDIIGLSAAVILTIFALFLYNHKKGNQLRHKILAVFLTANVIFIVDFLNRRMESLPAFLNNIAYAGVAFGFLFGPLLYLYTHTLTRSEYELKPGHFVHIVPFGIYALYYLAGFPFPIIYAYLLMHVITSVYMIAALMEVKHYRTIIKEYFSEIEKLKLNWLKLILAGFLLMWVADFIHTFLILIDQITYKLNEFFILFSLSVNFIFATMIVLRGLAHPEIFSGEFDTPVKKIIDDKLSETQAEEYKAQIRDFMKSEKPFLKPDITIKELSDELKISQRILSKVINKYFDKNFYDFINSYRIEEAKIRLRENGSGKTILEILYDCGFNSKSVFNSYFKRETGQTPTEYKKSNT